MKVSTFALIGVAARAVDVEIQRITPSPSPAMLVLSESIPEASRRETRVRVRAALQQVGYAAPHGYEVGLTHSVGTTIVDLSIAVGILADIGKIHADDLVGTAYVGELSLTGAVRPIRGMAPVVRAAVAAGLRRLVFPASNRAEAAIAAQGSALELCPVDHLSEIIAREWGSCSLPGATTPRSGDVDFADIRGMSAAKRAMEIAAVGQHGVLIIGPPGTGKTMLARRLTTILPDMTAEERAESTDLHSVAGLMRAEVGEIRARPFRAPHHTVSGAGLIGGGDPCRPGEVSLAHNGVLFLDELTEFRSPTLEALARVLDEGRSTMVRKGSRVEFCAQPLLVCAVNPCPCGFASSRRCVCTPERIAKHWERITDSPLFSFLDIHVRLQPLDADAINATDRGETSATVRARVTAARGRARRHGTSDEGASLSGTDPVWGDLRTAWRGLPKEDYSHLARVTWSIADLAGEPPNAAHVAEARTFRTPK